MTYESIIVEEKDGIAWIMLNRPEHRNALSSKVATEIQDAMEQITTSDSVKVAVIQGAGKCFGAGADLKEQRANAGDVQKARRFLDNWHRMLAAIENCPKVVIAAVHGFAFAGSLELMMACDLAIATEDAQLGDQHANFGLPSTGSATQRLPRLIGIRKAKELLITGDWISGKEAERIGLVNKAVVADRFQDAVREFAAKIATKSPLIMTMTKKLVNAGMQADFNTAIAMEKWAALTAASYEDIREGVAAFNEKRRPVFKGR